MTEAIKKLIAENRWQPIEEAPKDGEDVVLLIPGSIMPITIGHCLDGDWFPQDETTLDGNMFIPEPTHFRAIPDDRLADVCGMFLDALTNPSESMCQAARMYLLGLGIGVNDYDGMRENLRQSGERVPEWMLQKSGHITKWDRAEDIWKLMAEQALSRANEIATKGEL